MPSLSRTLEGSSKALVLVSASAALLLETVLAAREWSLLLPWTAGAFIAGLILTWWRRRWAWALLLGTLTLWPAIVQAALDRHLDAYWSIWMAGCLGALLADQRSLRWATPPLWRLPLAYWALCVALVWPVIAIRETDFHWSLINVYHIGNSFMGGPPPVVIVWILLVALAHLLGLLWFEGSCQHNTFDDPLTFIRWTIVPLGCGAALGCALAVYQGTIDVNFLSGHQWPSFNRAAGSLMDGDAFGPLAAAWMVWFPALSFCLVGRSRWLVPAAGIGTGLALGGMWASGSRIGFAGAAIAILFLLATSVRAWMRLEARHRIVLGCAAALLIVGVVFTRHSFKIHDPVTRTMATLPEKMSWSAVQTVAVNQLWNRVGPYGTVTVNMVREFPLTGVGIGSFNHLFVDFSIQLGLLRMRDNAQSWYRHQLAELGLLASLGWIFWVLSFGWILLRTKGAPLFRDAATLVKGGLWTVAIVCLVAMPTQSFAFSFSIWVIAAWYLHLSPAAQHRANAPRLWDRPWAWLACWALVFMFVGASAWEGWTRLRPPHRAVMVAWKYRYGFSDLVTPPNDVPYWWVASRAVDVFEVDSTKRWLKITVRGGEPGGADRPLRLQIWSQLRKRADLRVEDLASHTWYVWVGPDELSIMVDIRTGIDGRLIDFVGGRRVRAFAARVEQWTSVTAPPPGAVLIR